VVIQPDHFLLRAFEMAGGRLSDVVPSCSVMAMAIA
jgi:hypothetical protein